MIVTKLEQNISQIIAKISSTKHIGMTEIQDWAEEQLGENKRTTMRNIKKLVIIGLLEKKRVRGYGHERYMIKNEVHATTHRMYIKKPETNEIALWETQTELMRHIAKNIEDSYYQIQNKKLDDGYYEEISGLLWALNVHNKLTWAINSNWFGDSKKEIHLAKTNRDTLDKFIKEMNKILMKKDYEMWHNILHTIYDIVDSHRILTKTQFKILYPSSNNLSTRKRNK